MVNFADPVYGFAGPAGRVSGILGMGTGGGVLGGMGSTFQQLLDPQVALPAAAALIGGRTLKDSLAGGLAAAGPGLAVTKKRMAINDWLKAGAPKDVQHPAVIKLFDEAPELAQTYIAQQLAPKQKAEFTKIGEGEIGGAQYGWVDPNTQTVTPFTPPNTKGTGGERPVVPLTEDGTPDPVAQEEFLKTLDPNMQALVKGVAGYQMDISKVTSLRGDQRQKLAQLVSQYDPSFDMTQYPARAAMRKSITSGTYSQALNSANLLIQHADALSKAADDLHNWSFTPANWLYNEGSSLAGNPAITKFETAKKAVAAEAAKVFKGTGATSEQELLDWERIFSAASSPEQIKAAIKTLVGDLLKSRLDTIRSQFESAMGKPARFKMLTPHSKEVINSFGLDSSALDNPTGGPPDEATPQPDAAAIAGRGNQAAKGDRGGNGKGLPPGEYEWHPQ